MLPFFTFATSRLGPICLMLLLGCSSLVATDSQPSGAKAKGKSKSVPAVVPMAQSLLGALRELEGARFTQAEASLRKITSQGGPERVRAEVALAELWLLTGKRGQALTQALTHCKDSSPSQLLACEVAARALAQQGELERAIGLLRPLVDHQEARSLRLLLADLLAERGLTDESRALYRELLLDFRKDRIDKSDTKALAISARAAHRLGTYRDANELYNLAEQSGISDLRTLLWRGELYLDAHDPKHAREVADEALRYAPSHPSALLLFANARLREAQDVDQAIEKAEQVLALDPASAGAYFVLAGLSLRDLDYPATHQFIERGLEASPGDLGLLSLRAAASFLADDTQAFQANVAEVLGRNPDYSRLFRVVAEYAEAEHRYADILPLLRRAIALNPNDAQVRAQLGIVLLRSGHESEGRHELLRAYAQDPFDLRVRNTLLLFEREIDHQYVTVAHPNFDLRLPISLREPLDQIVSGWLETAKIEMNRRYKTTDVPRLLVELYADQDSFGVRTSGAPSNELEGVCFGDTIVMRLPTDEPVNLGMTLWHELSHVYHLKLSNHRVPRWFTEGLCEVETRRRRAEWTREQELQIYEANRAGRLPAIHSMNRAFSRAKTLSELSVAYVASSYLVEYLTETFGFGKLREMLVAWGEGLSTEQVFSRVLKTDETRLTREYRAAVAARLRNFDGQYFPPPPSPRNSPVPTESDAAAVDPRLMAQLAQSYLAAGKLKECRDTLEKAPQAFHPDLLWVKSLLALAESDPAVALAGLDGLLKSGNDGYFVRLQRAVVWGQLGRIQEEQRDLERAHQYHPKASDPLYRLVAIAREANQPRAELEYLRLLCKLEESALRPHRRQVELLLQLGLNEEAWRAAETLSFVDPIDSEAHELIARAALSVGNRQRGLLEIRLASLLAPSQDDRNRLDRWSQSLRFSNRGR